jgi:peptidoglycan hydrolase-like protein with peptidoglycan-binding domain
MEKPTYSPTTPELPASDPTAHDGERSRAPRRRWLFAVLALAAAAIVVVAVVDPFRKPAASTSGVADNADPTSLATVTRQSLSSQTELSATLGFAGSYTVVNQAQGTAASTGASSGGSSATFTLLPAVGQIVTEGQTLYDVDGAPVALLYGSTPAYRSLSDGQSGTDVVELNADLVTLGYATSAQLNPASDYFSDETRYALERFQAALGVTQSGTLALGQAVFLPTAVRVTSVSAVLGAPAQLGATVLDATSTNREVTINLDASNQSEVATGDEVTITLPNNQTTPGVIASVGTVASTDTSSGANNSGSAGASSSGSGSPTVTVLVTPTDLSAGEDYDQAPVNVTITTSRVHDAVVVPVDALLALESGGYAVEVASTGGVHRLIPVSLGLFDDADGLVQVTNSALAAGQRVVIPAA